MTGQSAHGDTSSKPGSQSPITAALWDLFGGNTKAGGGMFQPQAWGGANAAGFDFSGLSGIQNNQASTGVEQFLTGSQGGGDYGSSGGLPDMALGNLFQSQDILQQGANQLPALMQTDPTAAIAQARHEFTTQTLPSILEQSPGWSSSDLQREQTRAGTDLGLGIGALRESNYDRIGNLVQGLPNYAQALGSNLTGGGQNLLGYGQAGREFLTGVSPGGDAFRTMEMLQSLTGPAQTNVSMGSNKSGGGGI